MDKERLLNNATHVRIEDFSEGIPYDKICLASMNDYIPMRALLHSKVISTNNAQDVIYGSYHQFYYEYAVTSFTRFLSRYHDRSQVRFIRRGDIMEYKSMYGSLYGRKIGTLKWILLLSLCIKSRRLFDVVLGDNTNYFIFSILVNSNFVFNPLYSKMYKSMKTQYITPLSEYVDIVQTNNIEKNCWTVMPIVPKCNTLDDMLAFLKTPNQMLMQALTSEITTSTSFYHTIQEKSSLADRMDNPAFARSTVSSQAEAVDSLPF